ncbi:hypothetical protein [Nonlabens agnitus]|uniref:Uncharacterized protein n=1 Tax=Nonlabens agnitus TaxID=870484 RepID=A0A2S9WUV8_9FLAO|nr:hypothetical protein [Nonlabens agnitus]PRP67260.1 hypothetical protein BST86_09170 [Nonlabens agnitus]
MEIPTLPTVVSRYISNIVLSLFFLIAIITPPTVLGQARPTFNLSQGPTLLPNGAAAEQIGARYIYQNVEVSQDGFVVDAIVTIIDKVNVEEPTADSFIVDSVIGLDNRFEPTINTGPGIGYVEWQVEFVIDGTVVDANDVGTLARLDSFTVEAIDVDGFFEAIITDSYTLEGGTNPATELVVSQNGEFTRFQSDVDFAAGISESNTEYVVRINYNNISSIRFRNGSSNDSNNRQNSVSFLGEVTFNVANTTQVNNPPTVLDNLGNVIFSNESYQANLLDGASDPENNIDPTTIVLFDPNDTSNRGSLNNR